MKRKFTKTFFAVLIVALIFSIGVQPISVFTSSIFKVISSQAYSFAQTTAPATTSIRKVTVTFDGDADTAKGFTWYTWKDSVNSDLQVVENTGIQPDFSKAVAFTGQEYVSHNSPAELVHKASASGLKSNTAYYYRVGDSKLNVWSRTAVFKTASDSGSFTFIDLSDTQMADDAGAKLSADTISKALSIFSNAGFVIHNGDVVDKKAESQWNWLLTDAQTSLMNTTIMPAAGNHDIGNSSFIDHFDLDAKGSNSSTGAYYSVDYNNTHFAVLNTNDTSKQYADFSTAQVDWMKADIKKARDAGAEWIIVVMHMGPYSTASHVADANVIDTRKKIAPLFSDLGVDLVLQGHDHVYARSKPIEKGIADSTGTVYLTPGTAGSKYYYQNKKVPPGYSSLFAYAKGPFFGSSSYKLETFVGITIDGSNLSAVTYQTAKDKNHGIPYAIDRFSITKSE